MSDDTTRDEAALELIASVSDRLAERTDDDDAQGWASDLNQAARILKGEADEA